MLTTLRVWTDGVDWVIADSARRACELSHAQIGAPLGDLSDEADWEPLRDDEPLRIWVDAPGNDERRMTAAEWVAHEGKEGFLCSTEF